MPVDNELVYLAKILHRAAQQRRWQIPRWRDRRLIAKGGRVLHAIDNDIIKLFTSPWEMAPATDRRKEGYAEIFPGDERDIVIALGAALARFIFEDLSQTLPLVMLPPMGEEANKVFTAIARNAEQCGERALKDLNSIKSLIEGVSQLVVSPEKAVEELEKNANSIARFLSGSNDALTELRRFGLLLRNTRIAPPEFLLNEGLIADPFFCTALEPPSSLYERIRFRDLRNKWHDRLKQKKSTSTKDVKVDADTQVLARIEWINDALASSSGDGKPQRKMVLITGDHAIHEAANEYRLDDRGRSFGERYLRHPRAYLAEPGVLEPPIDGEGNKADTQFDQWLDTFLSEFQPGTDNFVANLDRLLGLPTGKSIDYVRPLKDRPPLLVTFQSTWKAYTRNLVIHRPPSQLEQQLNRACESGLREDYRSLISQLEDAIHQRIDTTWNDCFMVVADGSSYNLISSRNARQGDMLPRNAPLITFDSFTKTRDFVRQVLANFKPGELSAVRWNEGLQDLQLDDGNSGYAFYLALGVLFAAEGIWRVSAILANRALAIAERVKPHRVSGREAAFLRAVALRHSARHIKDLEPIGYLLDQAEAAYEVDKERKMREKQAELRAGPCRFFSERQALHLSYHLYRIFHKESLPRNIPSLEEILRKIEAGISKMEGSQEGREVILYTERQLLVSWIMTSLLRIKDENILPPHDIFRERFSSLLNNIKVSTSELSVSFYVDVIQKVGAWYLSRDPIERKRRQKEIEHILNDEILEKNCVMHYDYERFMFLKELVLNPRQH